jgi:hypothetical protein
MPLSRRFPGTSREAGAANPADVIILDDLGNVVVPATSVVGTSNVASVASSATVVTLSAADTARRALSIYNDGKNRLYVKLGTAASLTDFTVMIDKQEYYELPSPTYTGEITGIWDAVDGSARVTELSA